MRLARRFARRQFLQLATGAATLLAGHARRNVSSSAGGKRDNDRDRPRRICLRFHGARPRRQAPRARSEPCALLPTATPLKWATSERTPSRSGSIPNEPIGLAMETPLVIVARKDFPPKNLEEFIAYVKANSEKLNMGHAGVGSILYCFGLMLNSILGVRPTLVPFNGGGPATSALLGGQIDYACISTVDVASHVNAGTLKAYAIAADERSPALPNVPTTKEAGLPEFKAMPWFALFAPKGTSRPILNKLSDALDKALDDQKVRRRFSDLGGYIPEKARRGQEALATLVKDEIARWAPIFKTANINR
jgi:tripartite-type tricarboxylate transporter receptor subunit TctC